MDLKNLNSSIFIRNIDLNMNLKPSRPEYRLINQILSIGNTNDKNVVEGVNSVDTSE